MRRLVPFVLLALLLPLAAGSHPDGGSPRALGGNTVPVPGPLVTIEAEDFEDKKVGRAVSEGAATGGKAWEMPKYGAIETEVDIPESGVVWIEIRAKGSHPQGLKNPHMHPLVDGEQRGEWDVSGEWEIYRQALPVLKGRHTFGVDNFNNYHAPAADRTLIVDWVRISKPTLEGTPRVPSGGKAVVDAAEIHNSVTGTLQRVDDAREGTQWLAWGIGCYAQAVLLEAAGEHGIVTRLRGDVEKGVGTHVIVRVDIQVVDEYHVGESWEEHETRLKASEGVHVIDVCYDNDLPGEKRNLRLDDLTIRSFGAGPPPAWPQAHADLSNTRHVPSGISRSNVASAKEIWHYPTGGSVTGTPAYADGIVYFGDGSGALHAVHAKDGKRLWKVDLGAGVDASVAIDDKRVYVGDAKGYIHARERADGKEVWRVRADTTDGTHLYGSPVLHAGKLYMGVASEQTLVEYTGKQDFRGSVISVDLKDGKILWRTRTQEHPGFGVSVWSTPAIDPDLGMLFVGTGNAYGEPTGNHSDAILALRLSDGKLLWSYQATAGDGFNARGAAGPDWDFGSSAVLFEVDGRKLVGEGDKGGRFYVLDRKTGELVWTKRVGYKAEGAPLSQLEGFVSGVAYRDGVIYAPTTMRSIVHALDAKSGEVRWTSEINPLSPSYGDRMFGSTTLAEGVLLQGNAYGRLFALDVSDGRILLNVSVPGSVQGGISVAGRHIFVPHVGESIWTLEGGVAGYEVSATDVVVTTPTPVTTTPTTKPTPSTTTTPTKTSTPPTGTTNDLPPADPDETVRALPLAPWLSAAAVAAAAWWRRRAAR